MQIIPCYMKDRINALSENWLVAEASGNRLYDLYIRKTELRSYLCGPYWHSLMRQHDVMMGDILTIELLDDDLQFEDDEPDRNLAQVFITVSDANQELKPHVHIHGTKNILSFCT